VYPPLSASITQLFLRSDLLFIFSVLDFMMGCSNASLRLTQALGFLRGMRQQRVASTPERRLQRIRRRGLYLLDRHASRKLVKPARRCVIRIVRADVNASLSPLQMLAPALDVFGAGNHQAGRQPRRITTPVGPQRDTSDAPSFDCGDNWWGS
jgi:hypothetical protein